jgi:excisionase family DNA binding protein
MEALMQIIITSPEELKELISEAIRTELNNLKVTNKQIFSQEEYLTFNETPRLMKISRPTLFKRMRDNSIPYSRMGKRLLFPKSKIMKILEQSSSILKR